MNEKNQKVLRGIVIAILAVVFAAFVIMYLTGQVGEFSGFIDESSASSVPEAAVSVIASVSSPAAEPAAASVPNSTGESVGSDNTSSEPTLHQAEYKFRNKNLLEQHYEKHGREMGFASAEEYEKAAAEVPNHPDALHKTEKEDGDDIYYIEATNEFVVVSTDGYIRTYFNPDRGIDYFNKQ